MICQPCKDKKHHECPSNLVVISNSEPTGLSLEGDRIQLSGLCPCQHRVPVVDETLNLHEVIHHANAQMKAAGIIPPKCPHPECDGSLVSVTE